MVLINNGTTRIGGRLMNCKQCGGYITGKEIGGCCGFSCLKKWSKEHYNEGKEDVPIASPIASEIPIASPVPSKVLICPKCGKSFNKRSNRQRYCSAYCKNWTLKNKKVAGQ